MESGEGNKSPTHDGGVTAEQVEKFERFVGAHEEANRRGLPGPLLEVWTAPPIVAAGLVLQEPVAGHIALLEAIGSPVWQAARAPAEERSTIKVSQEDIFEAIFLFTRPIAECRATFRKGREVFREAANVAVGDKISPVMVDPLGLAVMENLARAFMTFVGYGAPKKEGEDVDFTRPPVAPKTGSAGG